MRTLRFVHPPDARSRLCLLCYRWRAASQTEKVDGRCGPFMSIWTRCICRDLPRTEASEQKPRIVSLCCHSTIDLIPMCAPILTTCSQVCALMSYIFWSVLPVFKPMEIWVSEAVGSLSPHT
ncbi:hypothetical protein BCR43DRAFT_486950 [Syncephalastrum racemosum]|uniref:Uncharacterized protein n=1 Tax=Syncephalastrum racemosum TaxID=13706 RepID=A0A1X2HQ16_SYNRA|nr:hypothetical protein BCR43DRAFT_486950 [Syncephalastrum racemosum]